jgi:hypothetical protein
MIEGLEIFESCQSCQLASSCVIAINQMTKLERIGYVRIYVCVYASEGR